MNAIERLKRDHVVLRAKLSVLEGALMMGPETWFVLREVCHTLSRQLQNHIKREEVLVKACQDALAEEALVHLVVEHKDEPELLRTINRLFIEEQGHSLTVIRPTLTRLIHGLRAHMDEEEVELFPVLERVLASREASLAREPQTMSHVTEIMAVNRILRQFPATKRIFDSLFVNVPFEGCDCLDEVAWRRGMEAPDLVNKLEAVISSCACQPPNASTLTEAASAPSRKPE
ncbi:MAG: hemerythrin domain-containing protein [Candidatus Omnitrophica bacterium]|nr:hemerythrin domain-containing protein [Candidatus Omnitrophota bacterium]